ncbi:MAG: MarR family transcriptional regulator [Clostridia bacterium]|nr:MarR family transcriptional regulator [Clostridia bacterium]
MNYDYKEQLKLSNQLCFPLYAAARNIINIYTPVLKKLGITYTQYLVFLVLWEGDKIPVGDICQKLMLDSGTLSPLLKKMQKSGYIERKRSGKDDRVVVISLTKEGKDMMERAKNVPKEVGDCVKISPEKAKMLYEILYELLENKF